MTTLRHDTDTSWTAHDGAPLDEADDIGSTLVLLSPVFVARSDRRRRLLLRCGYLAAATCLAYLAMLAVSITATPGTHPASSAAPLPPRPVTATARKPPPAYLALAPAVPTPATPPRPDTDEPAPAVHNVGRTLPARPSTGPVAVSRTPSRHDRDAHPTRTLTRTSVPATGTTPASASTTAGQPRKP